MIPFDIEDGGQNKRKLTEELARAVRETEINEEKKEEDMPLRISDEMDDMNIRSNNSINDDDDDDDDDNNDRLSLLHDSIPGTTDNKSKRSKLFSPPLLFLLLLSVILSVMIMGIYQSRYSNSSNKSDNLEESEVVSSSTAKEDPSKMISLLKERFLHSNTRLMIAKPIGAVTQQAPFKLMSQQFVHLHHMKTGGTSIDTLIRCSLDRLRQLQFTYEPTSTAVNTATTSSTSTPPPVRLNIPHTIIHECSEQHYKTCSLPQFRNTPGQDQCIASVENAAILSYCAPLKDLYQYPFQWNQLIPYQNVTKTLPPPSTPSKQKEKTTVTSSPSEVHDSNRHYSEDRSSLPIHAITILRHPVARVWSMYRFQTKACYQCRSLLEIYQQIDDEYYNSHIVQKNSSDTTTAAAGQTLPPIRTMCKSQLINHQTRNLLLSTTTATTTSPNMNPNVAADELSFAFNYTTEQIQNAIYNMQHVFTMIGLTEDMNNTARMVGQVFPWLSEDLVQTLADRDSQNQKYDSKDANNRMWDAVFGIMSTDEADDTNDEDRVLRVHVPGSPDGTVGTLRKCPIRHENASPSNNHCANNGRDHLPLPNTPPDDATVAAILAHNGADMELYNAALRQFEYQKQVLLGSV